MRAFLFVTTAVAGVMIAGAGLAHAQLYIAANPDGMRDFSRQAGAISTTTADSRVTEAMVAPYLPNGAAELQWSVNDVVGRTAPHPLFINITEQRADPAPQQAAAVPQAPALETLNETLYFDFDQAGLTPDGRASAAQLATTMRSWNLRNVEISGYADRSGGDAYNQDLSRRRAEGVASALRAEGLNPMVMETQWYGESRPAVDTPDGQRLQANRRVVIQAVE